MAGNIDQTESGREYGLEGRTHRTYEGKRYAEEYDRTLTGPGGNSATAQATAEMRAGTYSAQQGETLAQGQEFRVGLDPSGQRYVAFPHGDLKNMVTENLNPSAVDQKGELWNSQGDALHTFSNALANAANKEGAHWQGPAADAAHGFFKNLSTWAQTSGDGAYLASNRFSQSAAAAATAKNSMPEEVPFDRNAEYKNALSQFASGNFAGAVDTVSNISAKQEQSFQAHQQAAQVMHTYDQSLFDVNSKQPTFAPPPEMGDSTTASGFSGGDAKGFTGGPGPSQGPGFPGTSGPGQPGPAAGPGITTGGGHYGSPGPGQPVGAPAPASRPATGPGFTGLTGPGPTGLGQLGSEKYRGKPGRTPSGPGGSAAGRLTGGGFGRNGGSGNVAERLAGGKVSAGDAEKAAGKGSGSGAGKVPEERISRGGAVAAGKSGPGAMAPGGPAGKGQKEEDKEKKAPGYLQEEDADVLFGGYEGDLKPVPPVIGDKAPKN